MTQQSDIQSTLKLFKIKMSLQARCTLDTSYDQITLLLYYGGPEVDRYVCAACLLLECQACSEPAAGFANGSTPRISNSTGHAWLLDCSLKLN